MVFISAIRRLDALLRLLPSDDISDDPVTLECLVGSPVVRQEFLNLCFLIILGEFESYFQVRLLFGFECVLCRNSRVFRQALLIRASGLAPFCL